MSTTPSSDVPSQRRLYRWLGATAVVAVLTVLFLPQLLGSRWVYRPLLERLRAGDFGLTVDSVELSWLQPVRLRGLTIADLSDDADSPPLVQVGRVETDRGPLAYLFSGRDLGRLLIEDLAVDVSLLDEDGGLNDLLKAIGGRPAEDDDAVARGGPPVINVDVSIKRMRAIVRQQGVAEPLVVVPPLDVDVAYRTDDGEPVLRVEPTRLLDRVDLTPELVELGLGFVAPILAKAAWLDGTVSADVGEIKIPLLQPLASTGTAEVTFHSVRAGMANETLRNGLHRAARLIGREPTDEVMLVDGTVVNVEMADTVIRHHGLKLGLPRVDPRLQITSRGDVRLDDRSLDLLFAIPVPIELLTNRDSLRELGVPTVGLPVIGKLGEPELQWDQLRGDAADVIGSIGSQIADESPRAGAIISALSGLAEGDADETIREAGQAIQNLQQRLRERREANRAAADAEETSGSGDTEDGSPEVDSEQPERPPRSILDRLRLRRRGSDSDDS